MGNPCGPSLVQDPCVRPKVILHFLEGHLARSESGGRCFVLGRAWMTECTLGAYVSRPRASRNAQVSPVASDRMVTMVAFKEG